MSIFKPMIDLGHERVCFCHDRKSGLKAIIAIHSTMLGNALGGTRRWHYASESDAIEDVLRLSRGMTYKAAAAGLSMGGAKSVILLDRRGQAATEAEGRAMGRFVDTFNGKYIAAEDVGVDPQFVDWMAEETPHVMGGLTRSIGGDPSPFTAQGVVNGMKACIAHLGKTVDFGDLTVAVQGVGHVGYHVAAILHEAGAKLVVADINPDSVKRCVDEFDARTASPDEILQVRCDILAPCALGKVIDANNARKLQCDIVCGAANNVLGDPDEDGVALKNAGVLYAPDFVVNAGGLIQLAGLYLKMTQKQLDQKNEQIESTTAQILRESEALPSTHAAAVAFARRIASQTSHRPERVHAG